MTAADALARGRASFGRQAWGDAYAQLSAADREAALGPEDLERLAMAAHLVGRDCRQRRRLTRVRITGSCIEETRRAPPGARSGSPSIC